MSKPLKTALTQSCLEIAMELTQGPALFDVFGKPTDAVERYTGSRITQNLDRCLIAGALRMLEYSDRKIAEALKCDVRSIPLMLREAEKSGRIPALKDRLAQVTGTNAERAQIALGAFLNRAAEGSGSIDDAAMIKALSTAGGIATQNLQLLTGGPTEILELRTGAGREEIEKWAREMAVPIDATVSPAACPTDLESDGKAANTGGSCTKQADGYGVDTSAPGQVASGPATAAAEGGRGGSAFRPGGPQGDGSTRF